jgi:hypothetical protein
VAQALADAVKIVESTAFPIDIDNKEQMLNVINSCIATKFTHRFGLLMAVSQEKALPFWVWLALVLFLIWLFNCVFEKAVGQ